MDGISRDLNPGERLGHGDLRDGVQYLSRPGRGQIDTVNPINGKIVVNTNDPFDVREVTVPVLWFSARGTKSAWGRYMPMGSEKTTVNGKEVIKGGELVHLLYRNDGTAVFGGYDATATPDGEPGWTDLEAARKNKVPGFANFKQLKRGEFDFKSSGNAYIFGSNAGTLLLAGGQSFIKLDGQSYRSEAKSSEFHQTSDACETRFGTIFRKLKPTDFAEGVVQSGGKEFLVNLNDANPATGAPLTGQPKAKLHFGDIINNTTLVAENGEFGSKLRGLISLGDSVSATEIFRFEVDQLGNVAWTQGNTGTSGFKMRAQKFDMEATTDARFNGKKIIIGKTSADEPLVCGNLLKDTFSKFIDQVFTANASSWGIGNLGNPVPLSPAVTASIKAWLAAFVSNDYFNSTKAVTEKA